MDMTICTEAVYLSEHLIIGSMKILLYVKFLKVLSVSSAMSYLLNNQSLLIMTSSLFLLFAVSEIIGAALSNSLSLFGDAAAMSVDVSSQTNRIFCTYLMLYKLMDQVLTYFFNMYAEWYKQRLRTRSIDLIAAAKLRNSDNVSDRKTSSDAIDFITTEKKTVNMLIKRSRIVFEVVIPSISVTCLLAVTIYVSLDAVRYINKLTSLNVEV